MDLLFAEYNAGKNPKWDNQVMRIEVAGKEKYFSGEYFVYWIYHINVYCAPNISSGPILNDAGFTVYNSSAYGTFGIYDTGGQLTDWNVRVVRDTALGVGLCLTNTQPLVTYELYNNGIFATSKQQDSMRDMYFYDLDPGVYTVKAVYKTVSLEHQGEYEVQYDVDIKKRPSILIDEASPVVLDIDSGSRTLSCTRKPFVKTADIEKNVAEFNVASSNIKMQLIDTSAEHCNIKLSWTTQYSENELIVDSRFIFSGTTRAQFILPPKNTVTIYNIEYSLQPNPYIRVLSSQSGYSYEARRQFYGNGPKITGTGSSILFDNLPEGIYTVWATDPVTGCTRKMNGTAVLDPNPEDLFASSTNAISTKTYYDGTHSYADITYYDGLGAPYQTVLNRATPDGRNLVAPILYDDMYRDNATVLLPFPVDMYTGERVPNAEQEQERYYSQRTDGVRDNSAYSTNVFDKSGLDRIRYSYRPGDVYRQDDKFAEYLYETNDAADKVLDFKYSYEDGSVAVAGYAKAGVYTENTVIDEDGNKSARFTDANGNTVLDRRYFSQSYFTDTYYVYDPCFNRLVWVISPEGSARTKTAGVVLRWDDDVANQYCYRYRYDGRGNMVERKLPGCEKESFVYDKGDRLVFSCDGNLHARKQWLYHVYDNLGNLLRQNLLDYDISREELQTRYDTLVDNLLPVLGGTTDMDLPYDSDGKATLSRKLAHYVFGNVEYAKATTGFVETVWVVPEDMAYRGVGFPGTPLQNPKGLKTYEKLAVLGDDTEEPRYVERTYFYDYKKRLMQVVERNLDGGVSRTSYDYDLLGNVVRYKELRQPYADADEDMVTSSYTYDNRRRLIREVRALGYGNSVAIDYEYDDLGQLVGKTTRNGQLNTSMAYNLQGWQTDMQVTDNGSPLFDMHLDYYDPQQRTTTPSYSGNISEWTWRNGEEADENTYAFSYDSYSRLVETQQYVNGIPDNQFVENGFSYDLNSNIKALNRYEKGILKDAYNYNYLGNQLLAIYVRPVSSRNTVPQSVSFAAFVPVDSAGQVIRDPLDPGVIIPPVDPNNPFDPTDPTGPIKPVNPGDPDDPGPGITVPPGLVVDPTDPGKYDPTIPVFPAIPDENEGDSPDPNPDPATPVIPRDTIYNDVGYVYDSAGNVLYDSHAGLNIRYNHLNLIEKVMRGDTIVAKYSYLSDGTKLTATDSAGNGLYYSGSLVYSKQGDVLTLESCAFTGGRFVATATGVEARYFVTDHLGSVRAVVNADGEVVERNDYYPFGRRWDDGLLSDNRYRYNGKEAQSFLNNPYLDYGARQYDSDGAVWLGTDQLSELYYHIGSYAYCANNPINAIDTDGRLIIFVGGFEPNRSVASAAIGAMMFSTSVSSQMKAVMMASAVPNRDFSTKDNYDWDGIDDLYKDTFDDQNAIYTQGRTTGYSSASKRYNMGLEAGRKLVQQILAGEIELADDETIKLVGHSQGAAYAAGIAQALIDAGYQDRIGFVDYIAAHQPSGFSHPLGVLGRQFGSTRDILSRRGKKKINNIKDENYHIDGFGSPFGHSITGKELYDFLQKCITAGVPITSN